MQVSLDIPEEFAAQVIPDGKDPGREALELFAIEGYRTGHLSESEVRRMLAYESRLDVHALLKEHGIPLHFSLDDLEQDRQTMSRLLGDLPRHMPEHYRA